MMPLLIMGEASQTMPQVNNDRLVDADLYFVRLLAFLPACLPVCLSVCLAVCVPDLPIDKG